MQVIEIDAATLLYSYVIWSVFPRSNGLPPGEGAEGRYIMRRGETVKRTQLLKTRHRHLVNEQKGECR